MDPRLKFALLKMKEKGERIFFRKILIEKYDKNWSDTDDFENSSKENSSIYDRIVFSWKIIKKKDDFSLRLNKKEYLYYLDLELKYRYRETKKNK